MPNEQQRTSQPHVLAQAGKDTPPVLAKEEDEVRLLLARGTPKSAVERAKEIHKRYHSPASEALLVDAYAARIRSLEQHALTAEAKALFDLVRERYPCAKERLKGLGGIVAGSPSAIEDLVRPLNEPGISAERRVEIEDFIKRELVDLSVLAQCKVLPPSHPLRGGAQALMKCFEAATSGPVTDQDLALPEVSRRGPLAPWKMLVRAIAYFYRRDDAACEQCLQAIDPTSAPARLVPVMRAMLAAKLAEPVQPAAAGLAWQVSGDSKALRSALESLDAAFSRPKKRAKIFPAIQAAISACRGARPEMLERLRQHISIRAAGLNLPMDRVKAALGGPSVKDAYFWRLFARSTEKGSEAHIVLACAMWEEFRRQAIAEGWFAESGPEMAALYLHMAELLQRIPPDEFAEVRKYFEAHSPGFDFYYVDQTPAIRAAAANHRMPDFYYLFPEQLFERACAMDPHREAFEQWLDWAETQRDRKVAERAAESWRRAVPQDSQPLLYLMEAAEKRGALVKAFKFLEEAEKLDSLNPEVRRAALRLLVGQAIRHLQQRKEHLAARDLATLETLPQVQEGDRPAFLAALHWTCSVIRRDTEAALNSFARIGSLLESPDAAIVTCLAMGDACGFQPNELSSYLGAQHIPKETGSAGIFRALRDAIRNRKRIPEKPRSMAAAVARACALGDDMALPFSIPAEWESEILKELSNPQDPLEARELRALGEAALRRDRRELAYAASAAGLAKGSDTEARFLLLRARALPDWEYQRRAECIAAAAEFGRRRRDMSLVDEAVDLAHGRRARPRTFFGWIGQLDQAMVSLPAKRLETVLQRERDSRKFPVYKGTPFRQAYRPFPGADWDDDDDGQEDEVEELAAFEQLLDELQQALEGETPKRAPRKQHKSSPGDFSDQGDLPF